LKENRQGLRAIRQLKVVTPFVDRQATIQLVCLIRIFRLKSVSVKFQLYRRDQFYWWRKPEYQEKTTNMLQVTDNYNMLWHIFCVSCVFLLLIFKLGIDMAIKCNIILYTN
jgi:hypothetical protein